MAEREGNCVADTHHFATFQISVFIFDFSFFFRYRHNKRATLGLILLIFPYLFQIMVEGALVVRVLSWEGGLVQQNKRELHSRYPLFRLHFRYPLYFDILSFFFFRYRHNKKGSPLAYFIFFPLSLSNYGGECTCCSCVKQKGAVNMAEQEGNCIEDNHHFVYISCRYIFDSTLFFLSF